MRNRLTSRSCGLMMICLTVSGCVLSDHPVTAPKDSQLNKALLGRWDLTARTNPVAWHRFELTAASDEEKKLLQCPGLMHVWTEKQSEDGAWSRENHLLCFVGSAGNYHFVNFYLDEAKDVLARAKQHHSPFKMVLFRYTLKEDELHVYFCDAEGFKQLADPARLPHEWLGENYARRPNLQATPEQLQRAFKEKAIVESLFPDQGHFKHTYRKLNK